MWIMAHRGNFNNGYDLAPDSLAAFRKCVELGCVDFIETDVQITKDGQVICLHDNYLKRFTDCRSYAGDEGYVINFTREELRKFRLKTTDGKVTGEQIPTLEEVLTGAARQGLVQPRQMRQRRRGHRQGLRGRQTLQAVWTGCSSMSEPTATEPLGWPVRSSREIIAPHANNASALAAMSAFAPVYMIQTSTGYVNSAWISSLNAKGLSVSNLARSTRARPSATATPSRWTASSPRACA